jgi:hypothetical protein
VGPRVGKLREARDGRGNPAVRRARWGNGSAMGQERRQAASDLGVSGRSC